MAKAPSSVERGTPISAPLLRVHGAGPRYDVPGARKPAPGFAVETVKPQAPGKKGANRPGVGGQVDVMA
ncbi:MAG: hypothetical protein IT369_17200 [Candidatus Latescibacteria bacterium]|nr:hypothetical protein [Candidatus Latescibacterota bacterium]